MLRVWGRTNSLNVQKVLWTLAEVGVEHERIEAGMQFGVNDTADYRAMNPNGLVPTIDDDGFVLWESNAIVRYLAARHAIGTLCPADPQRRAVADQWMDWQATSLYPVIGPVFMQLVRTPPDRRDAGVVERGLHATEAMMAILDAHLEGRDYLAGDSFTMADIPAGATAYRWLAMPIARETRPGVEAWFGRLRQRPGFRAHVDLPLS